MGRMATTLNMQLNSKLKKKLGFKPNVQRFSEWVIGAFVLLTFCDVAFVLSTTESSRLIEQGNNCLHEQNPDAAVHKFDQSVMVAPFSGRAHLYRAIAYSRLKQFDRAADDLAAASKLGVPQDLILLSQASEQCASGDYTAAMMSAQSLLQKGNTDPHVLLVLGTCQSRLGLTADALKNLSTAIESSNSLELRANAFYERALIEHKQHDKGALADIRKSLELNPSPGAYLLQADILQSTKRFKEAVNDYSYLLASEPNNAVILTARGVCYARLKDRGHAIADFTHAVQLDQNCLESYIQRGNVYFEAGRYKEAVSDFQIAQKLSPALSEVSTKLQIAQSKL